MINTDWDQYYNIFHCARGKNGPCGSDRVATSELDEGNQ